jgi:hypothetical protein
MPAPKTVWEAPMPRRSVIRLRTEQSRQSVSRGIARAYLYDIDVDRQKHIDRYIDYFGGGAARSAATADRCGNSLLDADGAH